MKGSLILILILVVSASALKCYVGKGSVSVSESESESKSESVFREEECGSASSELADLDKLIEDVRSKIDDGLQRLKDTANYLLNNDSDKSMRRKKRENEDKFACLSIKMADKAFKSCVPKVVGNLNCTGIEKIGSICYCSHDLCNKGNNLHINLSFVLVPLILGQLGLWL